MLRPGRFYVCLIFDEGQQGDFAGAFDGDGDHALLFGGRAGAAAGDDFAPVVGEGAEQLNVFVVHMRDLVDGQRTDLAALEAAVFVAVGAAIAGRRDARRAGRRCWGSRKPW